MRQDLSVSKSINIKATPQKVWEVLTKPELIKEYLYGTEALTTWKKGSEVFFQGEYNGQQYKDHGTVLENIRNKKLSYSYWSGFSGMEDKPENYSSISYELKKLTNEETELTWVQHGFSTEENYNHSLDGTISLLNEIRKIAERN